MPKKFFALDIREGDDLDEVVDAMMEVIEELQAELPAEERPMGLNDFWFLMCVSERGWQDAASYAAMAIEHRER